jgi:hypothetical protein
MTTKSTSVGTALLLLPWLCLCMAPLPARQAPPADQVQKGPQDKNAEELLSTLGRQIFEIYKNQADYVAEEEQLQQAYDNKGNLKRQRRIVSNFYLVNVAGGNRYECREAIMVDGRATGDEKILQEMFFSKKQKPTKEQIDYIFKQNNKYNLSGDHLSNQPWTGLRYSHKDRQEHSTFYVQPVDAGSEEPQKLWFREIDQQTLFVTSTPFSKYPWRATGYYLFSSSDGQFIGYDITTYDPQKKPLRRWVAEYGRKRDGMLLPESFQSYNYHKNGEISTHSISHYKNYRRFTSDVKLTYESIE